MMKTLAIIHLLRKNLVFAVVMLCGTTQSISQQIPNSKDREAKLQKAFKLLEKQSFKDAIIFSKSLYAQFPNDPEVSLSIGLGYINLGNQPDSAIFYFTQGLEQLNAQSHDADTKLNLLMSLGKAYQQALEPQNALSVYGQIKESFTDIDNALGSEIDNEMQTCENARLFLQNPIALKIQNLGNKINSPYDEHTPIVSIANDKLIFTSRRNHDNLALLEDGQYPEKICYSVTDEKDEWGNSKLLKVFYKKNDHESAVSISADGKQLFLFKNDIDGKNLYVSHLKGSEWSVPSKLPEPINSYSQETHCSLSSDGTTMFFTSDREGGYGGLDIYMCKKLPGGAWGTAHNLGPDINTPFNEETPMIYLDGKTLYFASEGHNSMGMYDIFYSQMTPDSTWTPPINLGYPINTPGDDLFFVPTIERNRAYYATAQFKDNFGGLDIYLIEFDPQFKGKLAIVEGKVTQSGKEKIIRILVSRTSDQQLVGDYRPDPVSGEYTMFLETGHRYQIKQIRQITIDEEVGDIEIGDEMAFENLKTTVKMHDLNIEPPLIPAKQLQSSTIQENGLDSKHIGSTQAQLTTPPAYLPHHMEIPVIANTTNTSYTIQLLALKTRRLSNFRIFNGLDQTRISESVCQDGFYRYTYSQYDNLEASILAREKIIASSRFKDAFVRPIGQLEQLRKKDRK
ncbi:MAG: hypothetical protein QM786_00560 [Breznakibacter sp.]